MSRYGIAVAALALIAAACSGSGDQPAGADAVTTPAGSRPMEVMAEHADEGEREMVAPEMAEEAAGHSDHSDDHAAPAAEGPAEEAVGGDVRILEIAMSEFAFTPGAVEVTAGETVTFVVTNAGLVEHELRLSNAHRIEEHLASGHAGHGDESHHEEGDLLVTVGPGDTVDLTVIFPEDASFFTQIVCLIPGHYEAGMKGTLTYLEA